MEEWKDIAGFDNYQISNYGRVKNKNTERILSSCISRNGYIKVTLRASNKTHVVYIHRLIAEHFLNNPSEEQLLWASNTVYGKVQVNHIDGNKLNNHIDNLEWSTGKENIKHSYDTELNLPKRAEVNGKLTEEQVIEIRRLYKETNCTQKELGIKYNTNPRNIGYIINRDTWTHI